MDEWEEKCQFVINLLFKPEKRADLPLHDPEFIEFIEGMAAPIFKDIRAHIALQNLQKS